MSEMNVALAAGEDGGEGKGPRRFRLQAVVVFVVALLACSTSLGNRYALDDSIIILRNIDVQRGVAGIGDILTQDAYQGFYFTMGVPPQLSGGRYRPLSAVTFAIEQSLFGETLGDEYLRLRTELDGTSSGDPRVFSLRERLRELLEVTIVEANDAIAFERHAIQLLLFASSMVALLALLRLAMPSHETVAFVAVLFFALHPIHVEVVANVKSRDEILSLLFITLAGIALFRHDETRAPRQLALAGCWLFLALLSKEYAVLALPVLGVAVAVSRGRGALELLRRWAPLLVVVASFLAMRMLVLGETPRPDLAKQDILNDPFLPLKLGAEAGSVLATKLSILPHYARLLLVPHPLSSDYSYATFPFANFATPSVWLSIVLHAAILATTWLAWRKRHPLALAGAAYLVFLLPVSNLVFEIGATMGERLVYHASLGFAIVLAWVVVEWPRRLLAKPRLAMLATAVLVLLVATPYAVASLRRSAEWRDDRTLFLADVNAVPRSALANGNAGAQIMNDGLRIVLAARRAGREPLPAELATVRAKADAALVYLRRSTEIHPRYANSWINLGLCHYYKDEWDASAEAFSRAASIYGSHPMLEQYATNFHALGLERAREGDLDGAVAMFRRAVAVWPREVRFWRDLAGSSFVSMKFAESRAAFDRVLELAPGDPDATGGRRAAEGFEKLEAALAERPADPTILRELARNLRLNRQPAFDERARMLELTASMLERTR